MSIARWAALRQLEALRESVAFTLQHPAIPKYEMTTIEQFCKWLAQHDITPIVMCDVDTGEEEISVLSSMTEFIRDHCPYFYALHDGTRRSKHWDEEDIGAERSGVGWDNLPNFIITSAFVRLLGAWEQFELDALKALLYYRPSGNVHLPDELPSVEVTSDIVREQPDESGNFSKPAIWSWIRKVAENNNERKAIFKRVYGVDTTPNRFNGWKMSAINQYRNDLYDKRNAIAHGRTRVEMQLSEYCMADWFVIESIRSLSQQSIDNFQVDL